MCPWCLVGNSIMLQFIRIHKKAAVEYIYFKERSGKGRQIEDK